MKAARSCDLIQPLEDRHRDYLKDESRTLGKAESISFPINEAEVQAIVKTLSRRQTPITVQGSRTGIAGGAVPVGGHILNLSKMTKVMGLELDQSSQFLIRVQPGISLSELDRHLYRRRFECDGWDQNALSALEALHKADRQFWPPDPSERSASIGGIAANNSRGICAHHYGPAGDHIKCIRVVDVNGEIHSISRGQYVFSQELGICPLPGGAEIRVDPANLQAESPNDLMDLYLGSEGLLGAIIELTLSLQPLPHELWGIVFFFEGQPQAVDFLQAIDQRHIKKSGTDIVAIEYMDQTTLECIREYRQVNSQLKELPNWDTRLVSAVYLEIHGNSTEEVEVLSEWLLETSAECGSDPDTTWAFCGEIEMERLHLFRHAAPESVNQMIDKAKQVNPRVTKLGTDMRLQNGSLSEMLEMYEKDLQVRGLKAAIFGHAADKHFHVNILPQNYQQFDEGRKLIEIWAKKISAMGGNITVEHGVGKIKKNLFQSIPLPQRLKMIRGLKQQFDPNGLWNPGNMLNPD
jgi:D-lactate dehydrogenase (cytochrome)